MQLEVSRYRQAIVTLQIYNMPVTYLELENFKSYAGKQRIGPFRDFTSVIGPNGSGKSNLMDAISFILGVQSRDLRSSQLRDLIFRPPGKLTDDEDNDDGNEDEDLEEESAPAKGLKASATLVYEDDETKDETRFSRTISSKGVGEYRINGKAIPFIKYEEALSKIGVLLKGRNFLVFQGDVESTARKTPRELVSWFEDVSGSVDLKEAYDEAFQNMQDAETTARTASQKQKGFSKKKRELKGQRDEAEKFRGLVDTKAKVLTDYFLWQLFHIRTDIEEKEEVLDELAEELDVAGKTVEKKADAVRASKKEASSGRRAAAKLEKKRVDLAAEVDKAQPSIIKVEAEIKNLEKKILSENKKQDKITSDAEAHEQTLVKLENEIKEYTETEEHLQQEYEEMKTSRSEGKVSLTEEQEIEYERIREAAAIASAKSRQSLNASNRKLDNARAKAAAFSEDHKELKRRQLEVKQKIKDLIERRDTLQESIEKTKKDLASGKVNLHDVQKAVQEDQVKRGAIDVELEKINHTLRDARDDRRKNQHEARVEEAITSLKRFFPGVKGRLVKLCQPSMKRFDLAVTVAGGKDMDAVVVDTKKTAFDCIEYLRSNQVGTATFLPLDSLKVPNPATTERIRATIEHDSRYRLAYDVITCPDEDVKKAILYAVGNAVVCEDLDCARHLCFGDGSRSNRRESERVKAVTLGGAVISKAGTMTGGVTNEERSRAGRWNDREFEKIRERKDKLESELEQLNMADGGANPDRRLSRGGRTSKIEELRNNVGNLTNRLQYAASDLSFTKKKLTEQETLNESMITEAKKVARNLKDMENKIESANRNVQIAMEEVKDTEDKHFAPFRQKTGMTDFSAYDEAVGKARENYLKKRRTIREHLEKLKAQKSFEDGRDFDEAISKKVKTVESLQEKLFTTKDRQHESMEAIADSKAKLANVESDLHQAREVEKTLEVGVREAQTMYKEVQVESNKLSKSISTEEANLERLRAKLHETLQKARVEEAEIPLVDADGSEVVDIESRASRSARRNSPDEDSQESNEPLTQGTQGSMHFSQNNDSRVMRDRNDTNRVDFTHLRSQLKQRLSDRKEKEMLKKFEDDVEKLSAQIESMTPNMKAGDAFDTVVDQLEECNEGFTDAKDKSKKATKHFEDIKRKRTHRFNVAFKHIAESLETIYTDMTKSSKHPLGGNAYLSLDDAEEPYNGGIKFTAMPPMKRYRDMEYLSGGEKTIAALALLFAIHSHHPAPFFVMDEVDAALDNVNVLKLCNYIRHRSKDFQCIVISLKDVFYEKSQGLVGICRHVETNSSRTLTLDLTQFDKNDKTEQSNGATSKKRRRDSSTETSERAKKRSSISMDTSLQ